MNQPSVSIIIPVYNVEPYVEDCIKSVMRQTYDGSMECIVVDDCGTDNSMAVVERLVAEYNGPITFKVLHHEHNRGLSAARNTGMDAATGDYLFFLDSDDWLSDDCIEKLANVVITDNDTQVVQGNWETISGKEFYIKTKNFSFLHIYTNKDARHYCYHGNQMPYVWNKLISISFIRNFKLRFKEGVLWEDQIWNFYMLKYLSNVAFVSDNTYYYRVRPNSIVTGTDKKIRHSYQRIIYLEILNHLTPGYESEELIFYIHNFVKRYTSFPLLYKDVFHLFWKRAWAYKSFFCCRMLLYTYLIKTKWGRFLVAVLRRIRHPLLILKDVRSLDLHIRRRKEEQG